MTEGDVVDFLNGTSAHLAKDTLPKLAFDTNAIFGNSPGDSGIQILNNINRANQLRGASPVIGLVVSATVLHEKIRQMAQRFGEKFDHEVPMQFVRGKEITVESFDEAQAIAVAKRLHRLYPKSEDWRAFKKRRCLECVGLRADTPASGSGEQCGATIDWLVVGHAEAQGYLLVSNDRGPEFAEVTLRATIDVVLAASERVLRDRTQPA
jgi:hypothetical protein